MAQPICKTLNCKQRLFYPKSVETGRCATCRGEKLGPANMLTKTKCALCGAESTSATPVAEKTINITSRKIRF